MTRVELRELITLAERLAAAGERATLATLFCASGSAYRPLGSVMVSGYGSAYMAGGVSGGCLEAYVAQHGRLLTERSPAALLTFSADSDDNDDGVPEPGCGGSIDVLVERITPEHLDFLRRFGTAHEADRAATAACVINVTGGSCGRVTRRLWAAGESDGGPTDAQLETLRQTALAEEQSQHGVLVGSRRALLYYVRPLTRLVILGAGNDARPLCTLAHDLGWHVTVADRRARLAKRSRFPDADQVVAADWRSVARGVTFTERTAVVMMTHSFADDIELLPLLADKPFAYFGVLGPSHRRRWLLDEVEAVSPLDPAFTDQLRGPMGLDLGERSATGIAVSVVAEMLAALNDRSATPLTRPVRQTTPECSASW